MYVNGMLEWPSHTLTCFSVAPFVCIALAQARRRSCIETFGKAFASRTLRMAFQWIGFGHAFGVHPSDAISDVRARRSTASHRHAVYIRRAEFVPNLGSRRGVLGPILSTRSGRSARGEMAKNPMISAEEKGFEPLVALRPRRFSKPVP